MFTYPVTKANVKEAFGDDLLESAYFGLRADHSFSRREVSGEITGRVILTVSVGIDHMSEEYRQRASLYGYRVRKEDWSKHLQWQTREIMRTRLRPWFEVMFARPEIAWGGYEERLVELREGALHVHRQRAK